MYEYALYKGDTFVDMGTADYLAELLNVRRETIKWLASPSARKRRRKGEDSNALICVRIDMNELLKEMEEI
ncbi:MAG: hypothetical protein NC483_00705 [Ruminococcus sp.]|nr:hypothetical protein [Ruminococcus sp.]